jgi:plastocyanin
MNPVPTNSAHEVPAAPAPPEQRGSRPIWLLLAVLGVVAAFVLLIVVVVGGTGSSGHSHTFEYRVPSGTGAAIEAGKKLYVFPGTLDVHVGDQIVIHNDDVRVATVGPYTVDRNSTLTQTFTSPGVITGLCSIHPSGRVTINVTQ